MEKLKEKTIKEKVPKKTLNISSVKEMNDGFLTFKQLINNIKKGKF